MATTITATELVRRLGDVLARIRYRRESFIVERNGRAVARLVPVTQEGATVETALSTWLSHDEADDDFATDLARVNAADAPPENPWGS